MNDYSVMDTYPDLGTWLKADDFKKSDGTYATVVATIERVEMVQVAVERGSSEMRNQLELHFVGKDKCLKLNNTNARTLGMAFGDRTGTWPGKQITMSIISTNFGPGIAAHAAGAPGVTSEPGPVVTSEPGPVVTSQPDDFEDDIPF